MDYEDIICYESLMASVVFGLWPDETTPWDIMDDFKLLFSCFYEIIRSIRVALLD